MFARALSLLVAAAGVASGADQVCSAEEWQAIPRENKCEACMFVVDMAMLAVEDDIYRQKGDKSWGELEMSLNTPKVLAKENLCQKAFLEKYWGAFVNEKSDLRAEPATTKKQLHILCHALVAERWHELNTMFVGLFTAKRVPLMMVAEKMPDKKIPKGNFKQRAEQFYESVCTMDGVCTAEETKPIYGRKTKAVEDRYLGKQT